MINRDQKVAHCAPVSQHEIDTIRTVSGKRRAVIEPPSPVNGAVSYGHVTRRASREFSRNPSLALAALSPDVLDDMRSAELHFDGAEPVQRVVLFHPPGGTPTDALFAERWVTPPSGRPLSFELNTVVGAAQRIEEPRSADPALSWEYWDGAAWWTIKDLVDGTDNLRSTGLVTFCVPTTLQPTEVAGRANRWIRARLVAGDYGRESVTIRSSTDTSVKPPVTTQTVDRSIAGIAAPQLASVDLRYSVCCATSPDHVVTSDGAAVRLQTEANLSPSAAVELFVPLAETISRAGGATAATVLPSDAGPAKQRPPECAECGQPSPPPASNTVASQSADASVGARALYLGFDRELKGGPISLLFLVDEGGNDAAYPLQLEALRDGRFEPVIVQDGTRGLNESGVVTFFLSAAPTQTSLFGQLQHWLRLRPNPRFTGDWRPAIRAAYLNAAWARASETQRNELLGSSDGSPNQSVFLTRPPILEDSLRLRVWEPLGDEEAAAMRAIDPDAVLDELNHRPGPWVLWREVADPVDAAADERVYALDDETGELRFGDAIHGKVPPAHQDSMIAERYLRGGGQAANAIRAWSQINLVTPVRGVESVAAPEGAAGGADAQDADTALRFAPANLYMRDRALTLRDLEMLALQFSPDVAQAQALAQSPAVRLVVLMRGREPRPSPSVRRELTRYLLRLAPPTLAADSCRARASTSPRVTSHRADASSGAARDWVYRARRLRCPGSGPADRGTARSRDRRPRSIRVAARRAALGSRGGCHAGRHRPPGRHRRAAAVRGEG